MRGVRTNTLILEGYPGTGKTHTLAITVIVLMLIGTRVIITSQSNNGVQALFEKILALIQTYPELQHLQDQVVQLRSERDEQTYAQYEQSGDLRRSVKFAAANFWMSGRIATYCKSHPDEPVVLQYHAHIKARRAGKEDDSLPPWSKVLNILRGMVFDASLLVACTTYVAGGLNPKGHTQFKANAIFLDEAGQAVEADMLMAVIPHIGKLHLLVLCGDVQQLGPVAKSEDHNPLYRILATSTLKRLLDGWPQITRVPLTYNYRGHPSTYAMSNCVFYGGIMKPGHPVSHWDTELAQTITRILKQKVTRATRYPLQALDANNRQLFLNVDSPSEREVHGTSYFNQGGILAVEGLVKMLHEGGIALKDIGIITMYKEDLRLLVQQLRLNGFDDVEVGKVDLGYGVRVATVDSFQGKEKPVMIVHFVAAHKYGLGGDPFGFVKQQLRLNVATTRSQEFQFLVGNMSCWQPWRASRTTDDCKHMAHVIDWIINSHQMVDWSTVEGLLDDDKVKWVDEKSS
ncbi:hypothetical protein M409DRAFT_52043 [Zasmidium cellare ATCC 36951]|uniref:Uncharacterized protein n=1 Tax=Zasmidium cellare ATCC 36951 TaxID=1080233 RepID=A0A6A6CUK5_ZASCE|nr:uncharacterized protein M409DRAFT_52043 [Zasmidium cellare ATCC 36951]KAF2169502.1 hypothetical protein M409DRAFT_52043 [Zasmidium cellare ATCC 36951]